jgi:hypothetical protein
VGFRGEISAVSTGSFTLTLSDSTVVSFVLTSDTKIKIPTLGNGSTEENLMVGQKAAVRAKDDGTGNWVALTVQIIPGKPEIVHHVGIVTEYTAGTSITILDNKGNSFTFLITETTKILPADRADLLKVGALVTIIAPRDVTGGPLTARGIVVHPEGIGTGTPGGTEEPEITETPEATETPEFTETPEPTETLEPTEMPTFTETPTPTELPAL